MKKILLNILVFFLFNQLIYCQVTEADYYNVLNQIIERYNITTLNKTGGSIYIPEEDKGYFFDWCTIGVDSNINRLQIDSLFIEKQLNRSKEIHWEKKKITRDITLRRHSEIYISIPLFLNPEKDLVVVYYSVVRGPLDGEGMFRLYQKKEKKWKLINIMLLWVS